MRHSMRGSISLPCLFISLLCAAFVVPVLLWSGREIARERDFLRSQQLRTLCASFMQQVSRHSVPEGSYSWYEGMLQPGSEPVSVQGKSSYSSDGLLNHLEVAAQPAKNVGAVQRLQRLQVSFSEQQQRLAGRCVLVAQTLKGAEYLSSEALYIQASEEEVRLPQFSFLAGKAIKNLTAQEMTTTGLNACFYYLPSGTLKPAAKQTVHGASVVVNSSSISIGAQAYFPDRLVLVSENSSMALGQGVRMDKALLMAKGNITLGADCKIKGLVIAKNIILQGKVTLTPDAEVTQVFTTPFYPNL